MLDGKWNKMMSLAPGWTATYQKMPPIDSVQVTLGSRMHIFLPGQDIEYATGILNVLPCLNPYTKKILSLNYIIKVIKHLIGKQRHMRLG